MRVSKGLGLAVTLASAGAFAPLAARATLSAAQLPVEELARRSDLVVHGDVQRVTSYREGDRIFTLVDIRVREAWKGTPETGTISVRMYGGVLGGLRTRVLGAPCFSEGEELVAFLGVLDRDAYGVVGFAEGKFEVLHDGDGRPKVRRDLSETTYLDPTSPADLSSTLEGLERSVRAASRGGER